CAATDSVGAGLLATEEVSGNALAETGFSAELADCRKYQVTPAAATSTPAAIAAANRGLFAPRDARAELAPASSNVLPKTAAAGFAAETSRFGGVASASWDSNSPSVLFDVVSFLLSSLELDAPAIFRAKGSSHAGTLTSSTCSVGFSTGKALFTVPDKGTLS